MCLNMLLEIDPQLSITALQLSSFSDIPRITKDCANVVKSQLRSTYDNLLFVLQFGTTNALSNRNEGLTWTRQKKASGLLTTWAAPS
jgi:hypothetical protein